MARWTHAPFVPCRAIRFPRITAILESGSGPLHRECAPRARTFARCQVAPEFFRDFAKPDPPSASI